MATVITPQIVNLSVEVTQAPTPSQLQQSGAIVSCGGTTLAPGTYQYTAQLSDVIGILAAPLAITSLAWASNVVTATVAAMSLSTGQTFLTTIAGATPAGYNGTYVATVVSSTTFTYALTVNPGSETVPGTYAPPYAAFVQQAATTFYAQGSAIGAYILELGIEDTMTTAITALGTWITDNPGVFYAFLTDASWDGTALATLANDYTAPTAKLYFIVTTTSATISAYATMKSVIAVVPAPTEPVVNIPAAAWLYQWIVQVPSSAVQARPLGFRQIFGVTDWPPYGQNATVNAILTAYGNISYSGVEGGLTGDFIFRGTTMDGQQGAFWYAVDWFQIQAKQALAAAVINGSNQNPPLVYNQQGINALQTVAQGVANSSIAFGLNLTAVVSATSFITYAQQNPDNYDAGIYGGLSATVTPQLGFQTLTFNIDAVQFAA